MICKPLSQVYGSELSGLTNYKSKMKKFLTFLAAVLTINSFSMAQQTPSDTTMKTMELNEVVIHATRANVKLKDLPNKVEVVKAEPVFNGTSSDVGQLLIQNTGIDIIRYPGKSAGIGMRGFSPSIKNKYSVLLINGIPAGTENISTVDLSMVEQVEVMKGPFSSLYGSSAMAGVINIVTPRSTGKIKGMTNIAVGSFMTTKVGFNIGGDISEKMNFDLNIYSENQGVNYKVGSNNLLSLDKTEKAILDESSYGATFPDTKFTQLGANLRLGFDINEHLKIDYHTGMYSAKDILSHGSFFNVYGSDKEDITRWNNSIEVEGVYGKNTVSFRPYFHNDLSERYNELSDTAFISGNTTFRNYGFLLQDNIRFNKINLIVGVDNNTQYYETKQWASELNETAPYNPDYRTTATGILAQVYITPIEQLKIVAGGRFDLINFNLQASELIPNEAAHENYSVFNPSIGVKYDLNSFLDIHGSYGTAFLTPSAFQVAGSYKKIVGNPDLKPESSNTYDIGIHLFSKNAGLDIDATYFNTRHDDMIVKVIQDPDELIYTYDNTNYADMEGMELMGSYDFGALSEYKFSLKAYANLTVMFKAELTMDEGNTKEEIKNVRKVNGNFGLQFLYNKLSVKLNGRYMGHRIENNWYTWYPEVRPDLPALAMDTQPEYWEKGLLKHPEFLVFDANLYYDFSKSLTVGISAGNLFDENFTEKDGYNMPGRNFMGRCIVRF